MLTIDDEYKGKPLFKVGFLDLCEIVTKKEKKKFKIQSKELLEHIKKSRYAKNYVVDYLGIKIYNL